MTTSPYKWNDEAIYKEQAIYVPRQKTIATIFEKLRSEKLIYLRSPRGSGKTSLAYLIKDQGQLMVYHKSSILIVVARLKKDVMVIGFKHIQVPINN